MIFFNQGIIIKLDENPKTENYLRYVNNLKMGKGQLEH